ncbi:MAG: hypothetical protein ABIJ57_00190, partial [Pseudomonadota bacterium]
VEAGLVELESRYMIMKVAGVDDTEGCAMVHKARIDIKGRRVAIVKDGEEMRKDAVAWQKKVLARVNGIVSRCEGMENHLQEQEDIVENEKDRIKAEAEAKEAARIQVRIDTICAFGASFNGQMYVACGLQIPAAIVKVCTDEQFDQFIAQIQEKKDAEDASIKAEESARAAESERLAKVSADQETERQRLEEIARKQTEDAARIQAEQEAIEKEKKRLVGAEERQRLAEVARLKAIEDEKVRVQQEKIRAAELETARKEAAEKALKDAQEKADREAAEKIEKERLAKSAAEKKAARQPDKVKILLYADAVMVIDGPDIKSPEAKGIMVEFFHSLAVAIKTLRDKTEAL